MKGERVRAVWDLDDDAVAGALVVVVVEQLQAKAPSLDTNRRISLRIEVIGTAEDLGGNLIFLQRGAWLREFVLCQIAKQLAKGFGFTKCVTVNELLNLA
jgi:hypothetical protein